VCDWARQGVPLTVAQTGIDRYVERYYRKGPRRRPVRIEFCEADVLEAFDDWRRATGVPSLASRCHRRRRRAGGGRAAPEGRVAGLARGTCAGAAHDRRGSQAMPGMGEVLAEASRALDAVQAEARRVRGERRDALLARLREIDRTLLAAARETLAEEARRSIARSRRTKSWRRFASACPPPRSQRRGRRPSIGSFAGTRVCRSVTFE
jgi:hypothetical protein